MRRSRPVLLIVAKAPVPGLVKTRLTPPFTPHQAAALAAASLLDTLDACREAAALSADSHRVEPLPTLRDVDTVSDVEAVGSEASGRFGALARALHPMAQEVS